METIRIWFADFPSGFNVKDNVYVDMLKKRYILDISPERPDFLICSAFGCEHLYFKNCVKIFITIEAVTPDFNEYDYSATSDPIYFGERHFILYRRVKASLEKNDERLLNRKFCNFVYSQDFSGEGSLLRKKFCRLLMKYKKVDCPGRIMNNMSGGISERHGGNWEKGKLDFIKDYKFTIAFENTAKIGYVTDKLVNPLSVHSIPIYWGDPKVGDRYNTNAFVNVRDFNSLEDVVRYIEFLDTHDDEYLKVLRQNPMDNSLLGDEMVGDTEECDIRRMENFLYSIISRGNRPFGKRPIFSHAHEHRILCENTLKLASLCFRCGDVEQAKKYVCFCLSLDTRVRWGTYTVMEDIFQNDKISLYKILLKKKKEFMLPGGKVTSPENLEELCEIAKSFMHLGEFNEAKEIKEYVLKEDPDSRLAKKIMGEKIKTIYHQEFAFLGNYEIYDESDMYLDKKDNIVLTSSNNQYNYHAYHLKSNSVYNIKISGVKSSSPQYTIRVFDYKNRIVLYEKSCLTPERSFFNFVIGKRSEGISFLIYSGLAGNTKNQELSIGELKVLSKKVEFKFFD